MRAARLPAAMLGFACFLMASAASAQPADDGRSALRQAVIAADAAREAGIRALEARLVATIDDLLAAARDGDESRFAERVVTATADWEPWLQEGIEGEVFPGPLTAARLRRFASACRRSGPDVSGAFIVTEPPILVRSYECAGEPGFSLFAEHERGGGRVTGIRVSHALEPVRPNADHAARLAALPDLLDRLLAAASDGDQTAFSALVGTGIGTAPPRLLDERNGDAPPAPLSIERLRPFAACRPAAAQPRAVSLDPPLQRRDYDCGSAGSLSLAGSFDRQGRRIETLAVSRMVPPDPVDVAYEARTRALQGAVLASLDGLFAAAREGDQARFDALLEEGPLGGGPAFTDDRGGDGVRTALMLEGFRPVAAACSRVPETGEFIWSEPLVQLVDYVCDGVPGFQLYAEFSADGRRMSTLSLSGPHRREIVASPEADAEFARILAEDAAERARLYAQEVEFVVTLDALFAAARDGDSGRFAALVGGGRDGAGASFADVRLRNQSASPLTIERLRPIAAECRRSDAPRTVLSWEPVTLAATFECSGVPGFHVEAELEESGMKVAWLVIEGQVRRNPWE